MPYSEGKPKGIPNACLFFVVLQFCFRFVLQGLSSPWIGHILVCLCFAITRIIRQAYSFCFIFNIKRQQGVAGPGEITIIHVSKRAVRPPPCARRRHTSHGRHRVSAPPRAPSCQPTGILFRYHHFSKFLQSMHATSVGGHATRKTTTPQRGSPRGAISGTCQRRHKQGFSTGLPIGPPAGSPAGRLKWSRRWGAARGDSQRGRHWDAPRVAPLSAPFSGTH